MEQNRSRGARRGSVRRFRGSFPCSVRRAERDLTGDGHTRGMGMPADSERIDEGGLSRRQILARGAVAAGVVWAAPVIRTASAYATSSAGTERPCINFYLVAVDPLGIRPVRFSPPSPFGYDDVPADVAAAAAAATTTTTSSTSTTSTSTTTTT